MGLRAPLRKLILSDDIKDTDFMSRESHCTHKLEDAHCQHDIFPLIDYSANQQTFLKNSIRSETNPEHILSAKFQ